MSEKSPISEEIKRIQQQEIEDLNRLVDEVVVLPKQTKVAPKAPSVATSESSFTPKTELPVEPKPAETDLATEDEKTNPVDVPSPAAPMTSDQQPYVYREGDEFAATSGDWKEKGDVAKISDKKKWMETSVADLGLNIRLAEMKKEVDEFSKNYSKVAGEAGAKQGIIRKLNPLSNFEDYDEVKQARAEWEQKIGEFVRAFYQDLAMKFSKGEIDEKIVDRLSNNFDALIIKEAIGAHGQKFDYRKDYSEGKRWMSSAIAKGYNNFIGRFRKMHPALRIGMSTGVFVLGNIPATMVLRALGGLAAGKGAHEGLQAAAELWRQRKERKSLQKFEKDMNRKNLSVQERINLRLGRLERQNQDMGRRMAKYARGDYYRKFAGVAVAGLISTGTMARLIQSTGMGSVIKEKMFGGGAAATQAQEALYNRGPGGKITLTPKGVASIGDQPAMGEVKLPPKDLEEIQTRAEAANARAKAEAMKKFMQSSAMGAEGNVPEDIQKPFSVPESAEAKLAELSYKEIGYHKVVPDGGIERSAQAIIKTNPQEFGINPDDPRFNSKVGAKAHELAEGLRNKLGLKPNEFEKIASHKVQPGDEIRIYKDPATGNFNLTYNGAAFDEILSPDSIPDVSTGGAAQEISHLEDGKIPTSETELKTGSAEEEIRRPKSGAVAEQQPAGKRGTGKMKFSPEIEEMDNKAKASAAKALQSERYARELAEKGPQLKLEQLQTLLAESRLVMDSIEEKILPELGIKKGISFWNQPISRFNELVPKEDYIAQDVLDQDRVNDLKTNNGKLREIYKIIKRYSFRGNETIGECLQKAIMDQTPSIGGKRGGSIGSYNSWIITRIIQREGK